MKRIVVLGAGFAGLEAVAHLERAFGKNREYDIVLVDQNNYFMFTPLLPQIPSSYINPRHIVQPVRDIRGQRNFRFLRDTVRSIDPVRRGVELASQSLDYDYLIVALGSRTEYFNTAGAREHTFDFKSLEDAVVLREHILDACEHADHTTDAGARQRLLTFVVVGGGYTGVELVAELQDFLFAYIARNYRGIAPADIRLILLEASPNFLSSVHPSLAAHAMKRLRGEGATLRPNSKVTRCFESGVEINGTEKIEAQTVVWAAGVRAHELAEALPGPHDRIGRALVNEYLQLEGAPDVFVVGDSAAAATAKDAPRVAPVAIAQAQVAAANIVAMERGGPLQSYEYKPQGMLVELGMNYAVVSIGPIKFHGFFAWLFWNAVHLYLLAGFKKQVQVALDWLLATFFPRDAAIVRRPRTCKFCERANAQPVSGHR